MLTLTTRYSQPLNGGEYLVVKVMKNFEEDSESKYIIRGYGYGTRNFKPEPGIIIPAQYI